MKSLFIVLLIILLINNNLFCTAFDIVSPSGKVVRIPAIEINKNLYASVKEIAPLIINEGKYADDNYEYISGSQFLRTSPASFFVLFAESDSAWVLQMTLPTLNYRNEILIPVLPFFRAISSIPIFSVKINGYSIIIERKVELLKTNIQALAVKKNQVQRIDTSYSSSNKPHKLGNWENKIKYLDNYFKSRKSLSKETEPTMDTITTNKDLKEPDQYIIPKELFITPPKKQKLNNNIENNNQSELNFRRKSCNTSIYNRYGFTLYYPVII